MLRLFQFIVKHQAFFLFVLLEILSSWMIIRNNRYQNAAFFNSSNNMVGVLLNFNENVSSYFDLRQVNSQLVEENAQLQTELARLKNNLNESHQAQLRPGSKIDNYYFITARVINNSTRRATNFLTINKGLDDQIFPGMAVIGSEGIVGKVKVASSNFATVTSVLHPDVLTSSLLKNSNTVCTTKWDGRDPSKAQLLYVPRHVPVAVGDSVVSSGFNAIYPPEIPIGVISKVDLKDESTFYDIEITFATSFEQLSYVFVVGNKLKEEKDSLENVIQQP